LVGAQLEGLVRIGRSRGAYVGGTGGSVIGLSWRRGLLRGQVLLLYTMIVCGVSWPRAKSSQAQRWLLIGWVRGDITVGNPVVLYSVRSVIYIYIYILFLYMTNNLFDTDLYNMANR